MNDTQRQANLEVFIEETEKFLETSVNDDEPVSRTINILVYDGNCFAQTVRLIHNFILDTKPDFCLADEVLNFLDKNSKKLF